MPAGPAEAERPSAKPLDLSFTRDIRAMPRRVLITGATGFSGRHLAAHLRGDDRLLVLGTGRRPTGPAELDGFRPCDLTIPHEVEAVCRWARPDAVYHLAGGRGDPCDADAAGAGLVMFAHLRESLRGIVGSAPIRLLVIGSAAEIGMVPANRLPVDESVPCVPVTAYGRSKHALVRAALAEPPDSGLEIVVARTFNLVGPGLDARFALGHFAARLRAIRRGEPGAIRCGWLEGRRDHVDVRDAVAAYRLLMDHGPAGGIANVCTGRSHRTGDLLARLIDLAGVRAEVFAAEHPGPHDMADIRGSHAALSAATGWRPRIEIDTSLGDMLAHDAA